MTEIERVLSQPADLLFDPYCADFAEDPYPIYRRLRDEAPVYYQEAMNFWLVSRYDDVWRVHRDAATFSSRAGPSIERNEQAGVMLIGKDAPDHGWAKAMMTKVFSRARMAELDSFIRNRATELLDAAYANYGAEGEFNFVSDFTVTLPLDVISELLGIPEGLRAEIHDLSNAALARSNGADVARQRAVIGQLWNIYYELTKERRRRPKDDPISLLLDIEVQDDDGVVHKITDEEVAHRFMEMGFAGHETVAKAIPNGAMALDRFPDQKAKLGADFSLMPKAVQEILRFDPPSQLQGRLTTRETTLHGVTIPADARVMMATGAATRDERAFPSPDIFDIERDMDSRSIAFGFGVHKCLGIHLAQQEIAIAFEELYTRFPNWRTFPDRTSRVVLSNVRGVSHLPIVLGRRVS